MSVDGSPDERSNTIRLSGIPGPYTFSKFCRVKTGDLWVVGGAGTVVHNSEAGRLEKQITKNDLNGVYFVNSHAGWVVGDSGVIFHTEDQGNHWNPELSGVQQSLKAIKCSDEKICWAVGSEGVILRNDLRSEWKKVRAATTADLSAIDFINSQIGWAVGEAGVVLHTVDGGQSWEKGQATITLFPNGPFAKATDLLAVRFIDANRGWVAGSAGVARTVDGGKSWKATPFEDAAFIGIVSNDGANVWAIDRHGSNYMSVDGGVRWLPIVDDSAKRQPQQVKIQKWRHW